MEYLLGIFVFIFGMIVGSFINVVSARHHTGLSLTGRSLCLSCSHTLFWYDLIPLLSFLFLRGRCRYCASKISLRYPLTEIISGIIVLLIFLKISPDFLFTAQESILIIYYNIIFLLLFCIVLYDIRHKIISNEFVYLFIALSFASVVAHTPFVSGDVLSFNEGFIVWILAGPLLSLPFAFLWLVSRGAWIGLGDAKLAWGIGWLLGLQGGIAALLIGIWSGALFGILLLIVGKTQTLFGKGKQYTMKSEVAFGPFLALGAFVAFFYSISFFDIGLFLTL